MAVLYNELSVIFNKFISSSGKSQRFLLFSNGIFNKLFYNKLHVTCTKLEKFDFNVNHNNIIFKLLHTNNPKFDANAYQSVVQQKVSSSCSSDKKPPDKTFHGRHQYHKDLENVMNEQISVELHGAFTYLSMACYFGRTEIALPGCQGFFMDMHKEEHEHATILINYQLMRGGHVILKDIKMMENHDWKNINHAFLATVELEKAVKEKLICVYNVAEKHEDLQTMDLISSDFMEEQNRSICEMARLLTRAKIAENNPIGEYLFDQMLFESYVKKSDNNLMYTRKLGDKNDNKIYK